LLRYTVSASRPILAGSIRAYLSACSCLCAPPRPHHTHRERHTHTLSVCSTQRRGTQTANANLGLCMCVTRSPCVRSCLFNKQACVYIYVHVCMRVYVCIAPSSVSVLAHVIGREQAHTRPRLHLCPSCTGHRPPRGRQVGRLPTGRRQVPTGCCSSAPWWRAVRAARRREVPTGSHSASWRRAVCAARRREIPRSCCSCAPWR
jgi:hypothetical protein